MLRVGVDRSRYAQNHRLVCSKLHDACDTWFALGDRASLIDSERSQFAYCFQKRSTP